MSKKLRDGLAAIMVFVVIAAYSGALGGGHDSTDARVAVASEKLYGGNNSPFVIVEEGTNWTIVYHEDSKVMYVIGSSSNTAFIESVTFTELVNPDGTPMLYEQDKR